MRQLLNIFRNYRALRRSEFYGRRQALSQAIYLATPKPVPALARKSKTDGFNMRPCECGHFLGDHRADAEGNSYCASCRAISFHKAVDADAEMWPEVIA